MTVSELSEKLGLTWAAGRAGAGAEISGMYIGDLLSWVMGRAKQGSAWVTIQGHVNIVAVAELKEVACVIVAEDAEIAQDTADKADAEGIPLLRTERDAFSVAKAFCALG